MKRTYRHTFAGFLLPAAVLLWGVAPPPATALTLQNKLNAVRSTGVPDYNGAANWANSPPLRKFVDTLPGICGSPVGTDADGTNNLGQCMPAAVPDITTYPGSDYYEIELVQYREQMHTDLPAVVGANKMTATEGGTLLRGYRQTNTTGAPTIPHYLGPIIVAQKDRPVRIKFTNSLPANDGGDLFLPVDTTVMGSGPGPLAIRTPNLTDTEICEADPTKCFTHNRADIHLHGGRTPWISDGTAHQWITPGADSVNTGALAANYAKGASVGYVPDMWFDSTTGANIGVPCAGKTVCTVANATNNPGPGAQTYYFTNAQSARLMFYHDHAWGITRLNVYAGMAAGYVVTDPTEAELVTATLIPGAADTIPLIIQDKTFVDPNTIVDNVLTPEANDGTDPTWIWGSQPGSIKTGYSSAGAAPVKGDLWWPHVYVPAQNPYNPDMTGVNPFGRWHYGPWFWPPVVAAFDPIANPYEDAVNDPNQPPQIPSTPNPSWGAEAFLDTPVVNGTAYPKLTVDAKPYRFRILNAAHDRFWNLQLYVADATNPTEVTMVPAVATPGFPGDGDGDFAWPADGREGGVPNPARRGPAMVQIMTEGGFLPAPVVLPNRPINWNVDPTTFTAGLVLQQNQGGGTLMLGPAERADVIVDFSQFAGRTLILYNDAPAPWPALDPHYDYYTGAPDNTDMGGSPGTPIGYGPNTRTIMQIVVAGGANTTPGPVNATPANLAALQTAFDSTPTTPGVFAKGQEPIVVGQTAYNATYAKVFPATWPNWGVSRITDNAISFMTTDGATVSMYPMEPKAIQDEMGEVFDDFGRMSAKLGLELAKTTAGIQTFILQNFVDPATEKVKKDQIQIWKITHNGVDTHPVHFHLFEVQLLNRVGWDGFIYLPDPNELGWKDTIRISPLEDTIVALRPAKIPVPFNVPNSRRPLNPAMPLGATAGFTNIDPVTGNPLTTPTVNEVVDFGHEYVWHCHILSHEEQDMMRPLVLNANSLLYTLNGANGFWQWDMGTWKQITTSQPTSIVTSGSYAWANIGGQSTYEWNGYTWRKISSNASSVMVASDSVLYATFPQGVYQWRYNTWTKISSNVATKMAASGPNLYANFATGLYQYSSIDKTWQKINSTAASSMVAAGSDLYVTWPQGLYRWNGSVWSRINAQIPSSMVASGSNLYANFTTGLYQFTGGVWKKLNGTAPSIMVAAGSDLYVSWPQGVYRWNGNNWVKISIDVPTSMAVSGSVLYTNVGGTAKKWEFGTWTSLLNSTPISSLAAGY